MKGAAKMNRFRNKKGFTLVECVVAMAVLAIMSLLLMMILNLTINSRNRNMKLDRELDEQVAILAGAGVETTAHTQAIAFEQGSTVFETIPPADTANKLEAEKVYQTGFEAELDALKYDFKNYKIFDDIKNGGVVGGTTVVTTAPPLVYGAADISGGAKVNISEYSKTDIKDDPSDPSKVTGYEVTLLVKFGVNSGSPEKGLKVKIPVGNYDFGYNKAFTSNAVNIVLIDKDTVRIQPASGTSEEIPTTTPPIDVKAYIEFKISKDDYDNNFGSVAKFYSGGNGNSVDITIATTSGVSGSESESTTIEELPPLSGE